MDEEIEKFDPSKLMQGVKDRIKATFISLVPDNVWEGMVQKEIDAFFEPVKVTHSTSKEQSYSNMRTTISGVSEESPFRRMVWDFCAEETTRALKSEIAKKYFADKWQPSEEELDKGMGKIMEEAIPAAIVHFFKSMAFGYAMNMKQEIMNFQR